MTGGAAGIYMLNNKGVYVYEDTVKNMDSGSVWNDNSEKHTVTTAAVAFVADTTSSITEGADTEVETSLLVMANGGGSIDNDTLTEQDKGYQEYIKEQEATMVTSKETSQADTTAVTKPETTPAPTTTVKKPETTPTPTTTVKKPETTPAPTTVKKPETTPAPTTAAKEPETTPAPTTVAKEPETTPAPTTAAKEPETTPASTTATAATKKGKVVTDEKVRRALIQMGFDPDNYVASELTFAQKSEMLRLAYGEAVTAPGKVRESVDWENYKSEYDNSDLPKPMG